MSPPICGGIVHAFGCAMKNISYSKSGVDSRCRTGFITARERVGKNHKFSVTVQKAA